MDFTETPESVEMTATVAENIKIPLLKAHNEMHIGVDNWREPNPPAASATTIGEYALSNLRKTRPTSRGGLPSLSLLHFVLSIPSVSDNELARRLRWFLRVVRKRDVAETLSRPGRMLFPRRDGDATRRDAALENAGDTMRKNTEYGEYHFTLC